MTVLFDNNHRRLAGRLTKAVAAAVVTVSMLACVGVGFPPLAEAGNARAASAGTVATQRADTSISRGRYLVQIAGCNDCHTPGWSESSGQIPESDWLTGVPVGFQGPWGTSYPANLRLAVQSVTEQQWLTFARAQRLPPMPWFALREMRDEDLRSIYRFIRALGPKGTPMPAPAAPNAKVTTPYIVFVPQNLPAARATHASADRKHSSH